MARSSLPRLADRLSLARDLKVSPFCLGIVSNPRIVCAAYDAGINFFFVSADMHWPLYEGTRKGLEMLFERGPSVRASVVVASASYVTQKEFCSLPHCEVVEAISGLGHLDLLIAGGSYARELCDRQPIYEQHRKHGHCGARVIGSTFHDRAAARDHIERELWDIAFIRYNSLHIGARSDVFEHLRPGRRTLIYNFKSTLGYTPPGRWAELGLDETWWMPTVSDHYRFALYRSEIDGILCSLAGEDQVQALTDTLAKGPLAPDEEEHMLELAALQRRRALPGP